MNASVSPLTFFQPREVWREAHRFLDLAQAGTLAHVRVDLAKLGDALVTVLETTRENYPDFQIPPYGIWRDFEAGGIDRWGAMASARNFETAEDMLAAAADLAVLGTFMKTRHPQGWTFEDRMTGTSATGRQASALAAFHMFAAGSFSAEMTDPYRVDAETLIRLDAEELAFGLQWELADDAGLLEDMQRHLKRLGEALALRPDLFSEGDAIRPGSLATRLAKDGGGAVSAGTLLDHLLEALAPVWEGGAQEGEISLGDSFGHSALPAALPEEESVIVVPFHLAAQEMVYALVEPFAWAGLEVAGLEDLTAPADEIHAALFVHTGAMAVRTAADELTFQEERDRMIELRAVSSALTDRLAELLRRELEVPADQLPLTCILEGGTHRAGRRILERGAGDLSKLGKFMNPGPVFWLPFGA
ncbi:DUF1688 family protein [Roseibium marinum]|uniref:Uncharacterized protein DUF1688 n=1 Tax=Roseibium marinum TaxID=281252 RepID=A0A2S3V360_9HYPH|nr:DUF1688 family protein [Roseibium marinum]POF34427.1 uncharacterized protein DUF1688 [Roseibium marinum]